MTELTGGEVSTKVVDADGTDYVILKGQPMGESVGGADGNYRRNLQFPEGLSTEVQQWSELDAEGFSAQLKEAGMVGSTVSDEDAEDVANAVARATTAMHRVLVDMSWLDEDDEAVAPLGDFTVEKTPERCARCHTVTFPEVRYLFRTSPETT